MDTIIDVEIDTRAAQQRLADIETRLKAFIAARRRAVELLVADEASPLPVTPAPDGDEVRLAEARQVSPNEGDTLVRHLRAAAMVLPGAPTWATRAMTEAADELERIHGSAIGGFVPGGKTYVVGENGAEPFFPGAHGPDDFRYPERRAAAEKPSGSPAVEPVTINLQVSTPDPDRLARGRRWFATRLAAAALAAGKRGL
ncbi:hypothetical protein WDZ11_00195 (plasmid) [Roseomonas mucosa]|uniref:hypothetical protein n=1 Tax=Roseomonas mucosa TaxID=207340 RepID=UPI0030CBB9BF